MLIVKAANEILDGLHLLSFGNKLLKYDFLNETNLPSLIYEYALWIYV